jgi:hypothetical protein
MTLNLLLKDLQSRILNASWTAGSASKNPGTLRQKFPPPVAICERQRVIAEPAWHNALARLLDLTKPVSSGTIAGWQKLSSAIGKGRTV